MRTVGDGRIDLDAAIHRPRKHHDRVALGERELVGGKSVMLEVLLRRRHQGAPHALVLQAQHHHHVAIRHALAHVVHGVERLIAQVRVVM